jgi:hypothetical protein
MGECTDRNQIDAGLGDRAHGVEVDVAGGFEDDGVADNLARGPQIVERHVVEQDRGRAMRDRLLDLRQRFAFDFDAKRVRGDTTGAL